MGRKRTPEQRRLLAVVSTIELQAQEFERDMDDALATLGRELLLGVGASLSGGLVLGAAIGALLGSRSRRLAVQPEGDNTTRRPSAWSSGASSARSSAHGDDDHGQV